VVLRDDLMARLVLVSSLVTGNVHKSVSHINIVRGFYT
jgi:hypothetical protein